MQTLGNQDSQCPPYTSTSTMNVFNMHLDIFTWVSHSIVVTSWNMLNVYLVYIVNARRKWMKHCAERGIAVANAADFFHLSTAVHELSRICKGTGLQHVIDTKCLCYMYIQNIYDMCDWNAVCCDIYLLCNICWTTHGCRIYLARAKHYWNSIIWMLNLSQLNVNELYIVCACLYMYCYYSLTVI